MKRKTNNTRLLAAGTLAALGASLCCITPVLALAAGIGGIASAFSWLDPFRPFLIMTTAAVLAFAWYQKLKPRKESLTCECEDQEKKTFVQSRIFLALVTALALLLLSFPYYSSSFFPELNSKVVATATVAQPLQVQQAKLAIKGMTCGGCESSVEHALSGKTGVLEAIARYEEGMARIVYDPAIVTPETLKKAIEEEVGYTVSSIELIDNKE